MGAPAAATLTPQRALSLDELSRLLGQPARRLERLLADDVTRGIVERDGGRYRLTDAADELHGAALRGITWERT